MPDLIVSCNGCLVCEWKNHYGPTGHGENFDYCNHSESPIGKGYDNVLNRLGEWDKGYPDWCPLLPESERDVLIYSIGAYEYYTRRNIK